MKKTLIAIALLLIITISVVALSSCNMQILDTTYSYEYAYVSLPNGEVIEGKVDSWIDYESDAVQVVINGKTYLTHYSNVVLISDEPMRCGSVFYRVALTTYHMLVVGHTTILVENIFIKSIDKSLIICYNRSTKGGMNMLQKNIDKEERKNRKTWQGYYTRKTPTKKEKEEKQRRKHKNGKDEF